MTHHVLRPAIWLFVGVCLFVFAGCANFKQVSLEIHYYTIEYDPPVPVDAVSLPYTIKIDHFQPSPLYDSNRIVFKQGAYRRDEYVYHKWRAPPGELIAFLMARDFSESGYFRAAIPADSVSPCTHILTGMVEDFYQEETDGDWVAVLTLSITLIDNSLQKSENPVLMQKKYKMRETIVDKEPSGLAKALSSAMMQISADILGDVYTLLSHD